MKDLPQHFIEGLIGLPKNGEAGGEASSSGKTLLASLPAGAAAGSALGATQPEATPGGEITQAGTPSAAELSQGRNASALSDNKPLAAPGDAPRFTPKFTLQSLAVWGRPAKEVPSLHLGGDPDGFVSQLPYKCHQNRGASVGD